MLVKQNIKTSKRESLYDITSHVASTVAKSGIKEGLCVVFVPHTTAAITINENADPDVVDDLIFALNHNFPNYKEFKHFENNSDAHFKASCFKASETIIISDGKLLLGTWQGIYFCEFDGPRNREYYIKIIKG